MTVLAMQYSMAGASGATSLPATRSRARLGRAARASMVAALGLAVWSGGCRDGSTPVLPLGDVPILFVEEPDECDQRPLLLRRAEYLFPSDTRSPWIELRAGDPVDETVLVPRLTRPEDWMLSDAPPECRTVQWPRIPGSPPGGGAFPFRPEDIEWRERQLRRYEAQAARLPDRDWECAVVRVLEPDDPVSGGVLATVLLTNRLDKPLELAIDPLERIRIYLHDESRILPHLCGWPNLGTDAASDGLRPPRRLTLAPGATVFRVVRVGTNRPLEPGWRFPGARYFGAGWPEGARRRPSGRGIDEYRCPPCARERCPAECIGLSDYSPPICVRPSTSRP